MKINNNIDIHNGKTLIATFNDVISPISKRAWFNDVKIIRKIFIDKFGRSGVDLLYNSDKKSDNWCVHFNDISNINDYHDIIIFCTSPNLFGGTFQKYQLDFLKKFTEFNGKLYYYFNDVNCPPFDIGKFIKSRMNSVKGLLQERKPYNDFNDEYCNKLSNLHKKFTIMSSWNNYDVIIERDSKKKRKNNMFVDLDWFFFDLNQTNVAKENYKDININYVPLNERPYDFIFYSVNTKFLERLERIKKYIDPFDKCLFIGLKDQEDSEYIHYEPTMHINDIMSNEMRKCKYTLVFSSELADGNIITWRYYECMYANILCFILDEFDPNHEYIKNQELKDYIYISSPEEYREKIKYCNEHEDFYKHLIELQYNEIIS